MSAVLASELPAGRYDHAARRRSTRSAGHIYIVTRYREREGGVIEAQEKYDVTNEFLALYEEATAKFTYRSKTGGAVHG